MAKDFLGALTSHPVRYRMSQGVLLLLAICFVLQVFSPLRLNTDAIVLLSMARSAANGGGFLDSGQKTVFPPGYPAALAVLMKASLVHSWVIISLNLGLLAVGLLAAYRLLLRDFCKDPTVALTFCSLFLLSFVVIKHSAMALTDVPFFCFAMCCLDAMSEARRATGSRQFIIIAVASWILAVVAIAVRRIGVALVPPLLLVTVCGPHYKLFLRTLSSRTKVSAGAIVGVMGVGTLYVVAKTSTLSDFTSLAGKSNIFDTLRNIWLCRLTELGEMFVNVPASKMPPMLHAIVPWLGVAYFFFILSGLAMRRRDVGPTEVFLLCYMGVLFAWPYYDPRFWLPVIPLLIAYSALSVKRAKVRREAVMMYCCIFTVLGFGAIAYSTRITFAGSRFPDRYGDGALRPTYCAAFHSCPDGAGLREVDAKVVRLLREYN